MILTALASLVVLVGSCNWKIERELWRSEKSKVVKNYENLAPFDRIQIDATCHVSYTQGDTTKVKVVASEPEVMQKTIVKSADGVLKIRTKGWSNWKRKKSVSIYITSPDLIEVDMHGAGNFQVEGPLDTDTLLLNLQGAGNMEFPDIICDRVDAHLRGVGNIEFAHLQTQQAEFSLRGVGNIDAHFVKSGSVKCWLQGVGDISLSGEARSLQKTVQGTGKIDDEALKTR